MDPTEKTLHLTSPLPDYEQPTLGDELRRMRELRGNTLRAIAKPAGISPAYLLKLERDDVQLPSPHVLRRLAESLDVSYLSLMELAGYSVTEEARPRPRAGVLAEALASESLSEDEQRAMVAFLTALRSQKAN